MPRSLPVGSLALLLAVLSAGAAAPDPAEVPAAARTTVQLLEAGITHTNGAVTHAGLGQVRLVATRDGEPFAGLNAAGAIAGDERVPEWSATTDGRAERSGELSPRFPSTAGVGGGLHLGDYLVRALGTEATSSVSAIQGALELAPLDLTVDNVGPALATSVTDVSTSTTSLTLGTIELTLGDLLPPSLIDQLPLGLMIDLLDRLPVTVPTVEDLVSLLEQLVADLAEVADAEAALDDARAELNELVGDAPGIADAEDAIAAAEDVLADAKAELDRALDQREAARSALAAAEAALADALADLEGDDTVDDTTDTVDDTTDTVDDATDAVDDTTDDATDDITDDVDDAVDDVGGAVDDAGDTVDDLTVPLDADQGGSPVAAANTLETVVQEAERQVEGATATLAEADAAVAAARTAVVTAEDALAAATAELDALVDQAAETLGAVATELREEVTRVRGELEELLDRVTSHAAGLPDLGSLLDEFRDGLSGVPVVTLGGVSFDVSLRARADGATAHVDCTLDDVTVFGQTLASPSCDQAGDLLGTIPGELAVLIDALPIDQLPLPRIVGLSIRTDASPAPDDDGITRATATATALALEIPPVALSGVADQLTRRLDGLLGDALAAARALTGAEVATSATKRLAPASVLTTLDDLRTQVDDLPLGSQLAGLRTLGVDVTVGHLAAEVVHGATAQGPLALGSPYDDPLAPAPDEGGDPDAGAPDPGDGGGPGAPPDEPPSLPATGGGLALVPLALLGAALVLGRRRT